MDHYGKLKRKGFTLIEILVVIAIIAILSVVVILTLNPAELLRQSRDSNRLSDLQTMNTALGIFSEDQSSGSLGSSSIVYVSIPDPSATSSAGDQCQGLGLPSAPSGTSYFCPASSTARNTNGTGWIPVNFSAISVGSPIGALPQDPINTTSSGNYYTYSTNGSQFITTALPESQKTKSNLASNPQIPDYPEVMAQGSNLTISPLWSPTGLVDYWNFEEGSGTTALDTSGNNNTGSWNGSLISGSYYGGGKVGAYAGSFDGSTDYVSVTSTNVFNINLVTLCVWVKPYSFTNYQNIISKLSPNVYLEQYGFLVNSSGQVAFQAGSGGANSGSLPLNAWSQVCGTINVAATNLYINGQFAISAINNALYSASYPFRIGNTLYSGNSRYFNGLIDDVRVYNRVLSASEIQALYNAEK